jgi:FAD/FMN-containing dehydrogenase/Fe-S oxidoreductase
MRNIREIPYNYTSYSDREIVLRFLGSESWDDLNKLRNQRRTGRSARMLFEILGDIWVVSRNHFIKDDLLNNKKRLQHMMTLHEDRLNRIESAALNNPLAQKVASRAREMVASFYQQFKAEKLLRQKALKAFSQVTHKNNIHFDPFSKVGHATDATDWRQEYPFVVITPETEEEIPGIVRTAKKLGLIVIPRGGGTGLCGGSVPLHAHTAVINNERLDRIDKITAKKIDGRKVPTITAQCGAVTGKVMEASKPYVYATDPTSLWACTIGGNIATNAGGKHAVIWGTCVDNLLSWRMVAPDGTWLFVERLHHNQSKIPTDKEVTFRISRFKENGRTPFGKPELLKLHGSLFRKPGLGKDVTRKALGGLPGVQKEGTDGFVTSATFVLHKPYKHKRTVCCEFFGHELSKATQAMVAIKEHVDSLDDTHLEGLEHFDQKYVKAINYRSKSTRRERPSVVLLIDVSSNVKTKVDEAAKRICEICIRGDGEGFIATTPDEQTLFWSDRGRMAAIAKHTNAFKLNEDVVIPLHRLSEYNDYIERLNIENSISNKLACLHALAEYLSKLKGKVQSGDIHALADMQVEDDGYLGDKLQHCLHIIEKVKSRWIRFRDGLHDKAGDMQNLLKGVACHKGESIFRIIQRGTLRISYREEVEASLLDLLRGHETVRQEIRDIHKKILSSRIVIATHMHAGDGNVHTNIPVNSNDYDMMHDAHCVVERIMKKAIELGGVISGEHGIGITKLSYMQPEYLNEMAAYKEKVDPEGLFNRGKLMPGTDLTYTYTPSFNLLEMEAMILEAGDLSELSDEIATCLRCGKCKPVCNTHFPRSNMLYAPRNKILATALIIEAFLYEAQTGNGISFEQFEGLQDVADHCTICHKCEAPCPVNIDFGNVTEMMRTLLKEKKQARFNLGATLSSAFLVMQNPYAVNIMHKILIRLGYKGHQILHKLADKFGIITDKPAAMRNLSGFQEHFVSLAERPLPDVPSQTARSILGIDHKERNIIPILRDPDKASSRAVFYFPGCGSERLYSQVSLATQALLFDTGVNVVLPPGYLCCGYPSTASGDKVRGDKISYDNRVLFHRLRNALSYLDFEAVIVSCGTCFDQLEEYELDQTFSGALLIDIHEYLLKQGVRFEGIKNSPYVYHEPCHTPLKYFGPEKVIKTLLNAEAENPEQCCGEAGTLAVSRPDISGKIRARKEEEIEKSKNKLIAQTNGKPEKILTSCPSCLQGLSRIEKVTGLEADYIVVELARLLKGENWQQEFLDKVKRGGIEEVLM